MKKLILVATLLTSFNAIAADIEAGKEIAVAQCAACHGELGVSPSGAFPTLAGQHADYIVHALKAYKDGGRSGGNAAIMVGMVSSLTDEDFENIAAYFAGNDGLITPEQGIVAE